MKSSSFFVASAMALSSVDAFAPTATTTTRTATTRKRSSSLPVAASFPPPTQAAAVPTGPSQKLLDLFNRQVTQEFTASQVYLSASIWFDSHDWEGMAAYMLAESAEERVHGLGFVDFANKRNFPLELQSIPAPVSCAAWNSPEDVWLSILELERTNTASLLNLAEAANECHDFAVLAFLNPFHMGQVNEEDKIGGILAKVRDENRTPGLLRSLDAELGGEAGKA
mmetsp:Transcript_13529/g.31209  ORF Transcript_13529/g.31209 Transcript_13529/m.31209 type:complete len:225 (-) Transcript_13529:376-1050(-)|eukprot:CAMPEP_0201121448 /NCGR_PEP_ID=MMETSP0850-20130426/5329_1 /ASSEMBLY_ACC=CAM_ASM_000622 /TAXON_ID=183588 /ORGANISM="Pseudo-nitzschia fraudulenta, Strain WWA7" /LENGTH=224 /DNA_ID=CAMNT_0047387903 /DNA_START=126 /DNA_END=800 /DNA_ORIENTATION=+